MRRRILFIGVSATSVGDFFSEYQLYYCWERSFLWVLRPGVYKNIVLNSPNVNVSSVVVVSRNGLLVLDHVTAADHSKGTEHNKAILVKFFVSRNGTLFFFFCVPSADL